MSNDIVVECETPTKTNLNDNTNLSVNILAHVLICTQMNGK